MSTQADVTARWLDHFRRDLVLRNHARAMLDRERIPDRESVLIFAFVAINKQLNEDLHYLGGMAAEW